MRLEQALRGSLPELRVRYMTHFLLGMAWAAVMFRAPDVALVWFVAALLSFAISK